METIKSKLTAVWWRLVGAVTLFMMDATAALAQTVNTSDLKGKTLDEINKIGSAVYNIGIPIIGLAALFFGLKAAYNYFIKGEEAGRNNILIFVIGVVIVFATKPVVNGIFGLTIN